MNQQPAMRGTCGKGGWKNLLVMGLFVFLGVLSLNAFLYQPAVRRSAPVVHGDVPRKQITLKEGQQGRPTELAVANLGGAPPLCNNELALKALQAKLDGTLLCKGSASFKKSTQVFNLLVKKEPSIIVQPSSVGDIGVALRVAGQFNLTVTVKCGGHNPAGFALNNGGMVIDMVHMRRVRPESDSSIRAEGGALWSDVHKVLEVTDRSIVGGGCQVVGVVGLALGGGVGWTSRHRGLVAHNVLSATVVLPNSTVVDVDHENHPDLFWALKGAGGSNFGVVSSVKMRTFPAHDRYFAGQKCFVRQGNDTADVMEAYGKVVSSLNLDDRLTVDLFVSRQANGDANGEV